MGPWDGNRHRVARRCPSTLKCQQWPLPLSWVKSTVAAKQQLTYGDSVRKSSPVTTKPIFSPTRRPEIPSSGSRYYHNLIGPHHHAVIQGRSRYAGRADAMPGCRPRCRHAPGRHLASRQHQHMLRLPVSSLTPALPHPRTIPHREHDAQG